MEIRKAPQKQKEQLNQIKQRYEKIIQNVKGREL